MKNSFQKWLLIALGGALLLAGVLVLANRHHAVDFSDNPALLVEVSDAGIATLDTYQGKISAPLADVKWRTDPIFIAEVQKLVRAAQREKVAFRESKKGGLKIWYETETGPECLNQEINALQVKNSVPNLN